jgi:hypothetical protein
MRGKEGEMVVGSAAGTCCGSFGLYGRRVDTWYMISNLSKVV